MLPDHSQKAPSSQDDILPTSSTDQKNVSGDDFLLFAEDDKARVPDNLSPDDFWNVLIVDDEKDIHRATTLVLDEFEFQQKGIIFSPCLFSSRR